MIGLNLTSKNDFEAHEQTLSLRYKPGKRQDFQRDRGFRATYELNRFRVIVIFGR
jgi:hypothetical protein